MVRRILISTGVPSLLGVSTILLSYWMVSRSLLTIPPGITLLLSGSFFLLGLVGLSYGVLSASWEEEAGSLFGVEQLGLNMGRLKQSIKAMRDAKTSNQTGSGGNTSG